MRYDEAQIEEGTRGYRISESFRHLETGLLELQQLLLDDWQLLLAIKQLAHATFILINTLASSKAMRF